MKRWKVTLADGTTHTVEADHFAVDGMSLTLYRKGEVCASFFDYRSVIEEAT